MKTFLLWDSLGDDVRFYEIDDPPKWLERCNGKYGDGVRGR